VLITQEYIRKHVLHSHVLVFSPLVSNVTTPSVSPNHTLHVEYAEWRINYGSLFILGLLCEYINLGYVRVPVIYRVNQAEYVIHIRVAASQEYVNIYSTRRNHTHVSNATTLSLYHKLCNKGIVAVFFVTEGSLALVGVNRTSA